MKVKDAIDQSAEALDQSGLDQPRREAVSLLEFATGRDKAFFIAHPDHELDSDEVRRFTSYVVRRTRREPFHYITGTREFFGHEFFVEPGVLIPRPETEFLVEAAIDVLCERAYPRFFEIGVGSGCISVSLLKAASDATAVAVDVSQQAIRVAGANAARHLVSSRLELRKADLFAGLSGKFDVIVSNPPYVPAGELYTLQPEVAEFEPHLSLFAGDDGLDIVRRIVIEAQHFLHPGGVLLMEIGFGQSYAVRKLMEDAGWQSVNFIPDLQGIERIVSATHAKIVT
jgi:release factor glutamine methyltransferase